MPSKTVPMSAKTRRVRGQIAYHAALGDPTQLDGLRAEFRTCRAEDYIKSLLAQAPPLSDEQRERLAGLLVPAGRREVAA